MLLTSLNYRYNCVTCGLVFDKGACTICALTCHQGHEVAYSRYSSFFCDCGAESPGPGEGRSPCKCLSPMEQNNAARLFELEDAKNFLLGPGGNSQEKQPTKQPSKKEADSGFIDTVMLSLVSQGDATILAVKDQVEKSSWVRFFFERLEKVQGKSAGNDESSPASYTNEKPETYDREYLRESLKRRAGRKLVLDQSPRKPLLSIRASCPNAFNVKMSIDSTTDRIKRAMLARHHATRNVLAADSRGRLVVAEPGQLLFCSVLPQINTSFTANPLGSQLSRAQMTIIGSSNVKFNIVGMEMCKANERHLLIWGSTEACVVVLSKSCDKIEKTIDLSLDLDPHESETDYVVKCSWVPGSESCCALVSGTFVKFYKLKKCQEETRAIALVTYSIAYEVLVRDAALVTLPPSPATTPDKLLIFILVDTGKVHKFSVSLNCLGELDDLGSTFVEQANECLNIPTQGIRTFGDNEARGPNTAVRSMGEACSLVYLPQSMVLLYKCVSACVVAINISDEGEICGSFELLPHIIAAEDCHGGDGGGAMGPFKHWTELGTTTDGFFRAACVGKCTRTSQPKGLCVEFNETNVRISTIAFKTSSGVGLGLRYVSKGWAFGLFKNVYSYFVIQLCMGGPWLFFSSNNGGRGCVPRTTFSLCYHVDWNTSNFWRKQ